MKLSGYAVFAFIVSALVFYLFYTVFDEVSVASTGYNATERGLFGWEYSFAEHGFTGESSAYKMFLIDSGRNINLSKLLDEIGLCCVFGIVTAVLLFLYNKSVNAIFDNIEGNSKSKHNN